MAFWDRKKKGEIEWDELPSLATDDMMVRIEKAILLSKESNDHSNAIIIKNLQELTKTLNKTTTELTRRR